MRTLALLLAPAALFAGQARYARLGEFEGKVEVQLTAADPWMPAERNLPLPESAWMRTGPASRLEIELDEGSAWRLGPNSQAEISDYTRLSTGQRVTLLSLDHGIAYFTGEPERNDSLIIAVPGAQVTLSRGARLRFEVDEQSSQIAVIEGTVRFSSPAVEMDLHEEKTVRVQPANASRFFLYPEITAIDLDRWSEQRDQAQANPASAAHVIERYGLADLDAAGEWVTTDDLGTVWKPKAQENWVPYQKGRWRWYNTLGYTWVSEDAWGWLPYHYGRWTRKENFGWVWAPSKSGVFKPGEVYWLRGNKLAGWGPLAPGENWTPSTAPQQFLNANTTYAEFAPDAVVIDPAGFTARPKEALGAAIFASALPSPAFPPSRLEATRPVLRAGSTRVTPVLPGVTFQSPTDAPTQITQAPPSPPMRVPNAGTDDPPVMSGPPVEPPPPVPVEVIYPVPVYTGVVVVNPPEHPDYSRGRGRRDNGNGSGSGSQTATAPPAGSSSKPVSRSDSGQPRRDHAPAASAPPPVTGPINPPSAPSAAPPPVARGEAGAPRREHAPSITPPPSAPAPPPSVSAPPLARPTAPAPRRESAPGSVPAPKSEPKVETPKSDSRPAPDVKAPSKQ